MKRERKLWEDYLRGDEDHGRWKRPAPEIVDLIASQSPGERPDVLDLGCGLGRHAFAFARAGFRVTASDASEEAVTRLSGWARDLSLDIRTLVCDVMSDLLPEDAFDIVLAYNVIYHGRREQFAAAIRRVRRLLWAEGLFYFTCPSRDDGKYGFGPEVAPHTFLCEKSIMPGDIHYFADQEDLDRLLSGFTQIERTKREGHWVNRGERQFYSNWHVLARKA
jgi:SAM-dependent methyltransferase